MRNVCPGFATHERAHAKTQAIASKDKALLEEKCFNNATLAHHAAAGGKEEMMKYLLEEMGENFLGNFCANEAPAPCNSKSLRCAVQ